MQAGQSRQSLRRFAKPWSTDHRARRRVAFQAGDFDQDGDQDMAMIAFFSEPDPQESFLYFENKGKWQFQVYSVNLPPAKWLVMEAGDVDRDGDLDLILGNLNNNNQALKEQKEKNIKAVWLINTLH